MMMKKKKMQNRLDNAAEALAASEKQLGELKTAIAAERAARPESVSFRSSPFFFFIAPGFFLSHTSAVTFHGPRTEL
jgi:hypothetical protein